MTNDLPRSESNDLDWIKHCAQTLGQLLDNAQKFETILVTPPWPRQAWFTRVPDQLRIDWTETLLLLPVKELLAEDAVVLLWCADAYLPDALDVLNGWRVRFWRTVAFLYPATRSGGDSTPPHSMLLIGTRGQRREPQKRVESCIDCGEHDGTPATDLLRELSSTLGHGRVLHILARDSETDWLIVDQR